MPLARCRDLDAERRDPGGERLAGPADGHFAEWLGVIPGLPCRPAEKDEIWM